MASYTRVFSPTIVNEFNASYRVLGEIGAATSPTNFDPVIRDKVGLGGLGQLFPAGNPLRIIPQASFGGIPNAANVTYDDRLPIDAGDERYIVLDNLSFTRGSHNLKFGFYYERNYASEGPRTLFGGNFAFDADANNPLNTGNAYCERRARRVPDLHGGQQPHDRAQRHRSLRMVRAGQLEGRRAASRSTTACVSPGPRPTGSRTATRPPSCSTATMPARAPLLYQSALNPAGQRASRNPITGEFGPAVLIGAYVPGTGDVINGMVTAEDPQYTDGFTRQQPIQLGPRLGFAWDVFGDDKTALRGGFGVTKNMIPSSGLIAGAANNNPPNQFRPQIFYGTLDTFLNSTGVLFPNNVTGVRVGAESADRVLLVARRPAGSRRQHASRRGICRQRRTPSQPGAQSQSRALRRALPAAECRSGQPVDAARRTTSSVRIPGSAISLTASTPAFRITTASRLR